MNDHERLLLRYVVDGDIRKAQKQARVVLENINSQRDREMKRDMLRRLDAKGPNFIELPYNLQELLFAEDVSDFPTQRFLVRKDEEQVVQQALAIRSAADRLQTMGIQYYPTVILHGASGTGKTMLARYIAHCADLPFVYVRFSSLVNSYLGATQSNIGKVFAYARSAPCVLCFDELDAVGMARGQKNDVGELNRVVIALMQELDNLPNNVILIGTTNRFDRLDPALVRRFAIQHQVESLCREDAKALAEKFFAYTSICPPDFGAWFNATVGVDGNAFPASHIANLCTNWLVEKIVSEEQASLCEENKPENIFDEYVKRIKELCDRKNVQINECQIRQNMARYNLDDIKRMVEACEKLGVSAILDAMQQKE